MVRVARLRRRPAQRSDDGRQKYCRRSAAGWLRVGWPANGSSVRRAPANRRGAIVKGSEPVQIAGKCRCCGGAAQLSAVAGAAWSRTSERQKVAAAVAAAAKAAAV